jgi:hypothetical protein
VRSVVLMAVLSACASSSQQVKLPEGHVALHLETLDGETINIGSLRGRAVLVTIMTTWSDFALIEVPRFKALAAKHAGELAIVCIALDPDPKMIRIFRDTFEIPYPVTTVSDPRTFTSELGPFGKITIMPTSVLLDRDGDIVTRMDGTWPANVLEEAVQKVAGQK